MLRKKLTVLLATVMMLGVMSVSPALAHHDVDHDNSGHKADDNADRDQGAAWSKQQLDKEKKAKKGKKPGPDIPPLP